MQLNEIAKTLQSIDSMMGFSAMLSGLGTHLCHMLLVSSDVYRQQEVFDKDVRWIDDRIDNLAKPHVRPIVREKAGKKTEFGAKISISDDNGFVDVDRIS